MKPLPNSQLAHYEVPRRTITYPVTVLIDDFEIPTNVGSVFRLCDALGIEKLFLTGTTPTPPHRKISKTSRSTEHSVCHEYRENALDVIRELRDAGYAIVALEITSRSVDVRNIDYAALKKICVVAGSENAGIKPAMLEAASHTVHIPMAGANSSMNVATACAIALFEITRGFAPCGS